MPVWDPARYLQFADDRSRPFVDLVGRVQGTPRTIVDLGCGPGHLTEVLRGRWPDAQVHGVDSSPEMIERASADNRDDAATYELADVAAWTPQRPVDLVVSNALFQWVPDQLAVIERLTAHVAPDGTFALQVPRNYDSPSHTLLRDIGAEPPFAAHTAGVLADRGTEPTAYLELFAGLGWHVDLWETTYLHVLPGDDPVFDWVSGTGARPYLQALPDELRDDFAAAYRAALRSAYPRRPWGTVFPFRRTFVVARRAD
ncbi:methyltransferase domain-containing protein [Aeromicrobium chenweiae]|uniref:Trans-aconitate methyltransferase n=1 Tax=Aeromicrobium chenweiae TaxID=2079793 RepID=A0A2S0WJ92_9ACTN|nr:methyltransferase domain-containing protein [Aeromicrobium chenweiae]AWB91411.1 trans-aconitate methyltransferase [Aeromicrobium chenweiae]TGN30658.1 methyltransferase domain-containing protein [Aeromicrobium chenweiae]